MAVHVPGVPAVVHIQPIGLLPLGFVFQTRSPTKWYSAVGAALANCQLLSMTDTPVALPGPPHRRPAVIPDRALSENVTSVAPLR